MSSKFFLRIFLFRTLLILKVIIFIVLSTGSIELFAAQKEALSFHGELKQETAFRVVRPAAFTKILNLVRLETTYFPSSAFQLTSRLRGFYNAIYDFQSVDSVAPRNNPRTIVAADLTAAELNALKIDNLRGISLRKREIELREFYLDLTFQSFDLRLGRQIVRWGVLEGARITDEINPLDFEEFILREVQDRYIPLWSARANLYIGATKTEFLWVPDLEPHKPAPPGSEWEQLQSLENIELPPQTFLNSEWGLRISGPLGQWDAALSYFYHWDDFPVAFRTFRENFEFGLSPEVNFNPRLTRVHSIGGSLSKGFPSFVFNTEAAYVIGKRFGTRFGRFNPIAGVVDVDENLRLTLGELSRDYVKYGAGAEFNLFGAQVALMAQQQYLIRHESEIIQDEFDTVFSAFFRKSFLSDSLALETLVLYFTNDDEYLIRPKATRRIRSNVLLIFGADIFEGEIGGPLPGEFNFIGFFKNNDRIYVEVSYGF